MRYGYIQGSILYHGNLKVENLQNEEKNIPICVDASYDDDDGYSRNNVWTKK